MRHPVAVFVAPSVGALLVLGLALLGHRWPGGPWGAALLGGLGVGTFTLCWASFSVRIDRALGSLARTRLHLRGGEPAPSEPGDLLELARTMEEEARQIHLQSTDLRARLDRGERSRDLLTEGVLIVDQDLRIVELNGAATRILELDPSAVGRPLLERVRRPALENLVRAAMQTGEPGEMELELLGGAAGRRVVHARAAPCEEGSGSLVVVILEDLTELRRLETIRRDFVTAISHELRTPLTAIRGYTETLASAPISEEQRDQFLGVILRNTERLEHLLEDLLLLSRTETGGLELDLVRVRLTEVVNEVVRELGLRFERGKLSIRIEEEVALAEALVDRRALEHVVLNLLDNAIKYTPPGGTIGVRIGTDQGRASLKISDTGVGIPSKDLGRIFERFYRVERSRPHDAFSTGLGLSIVKHLVERMEGSVRVESEVGRGSTFTVRLPLP